MGEGESKNTRVRFLDGVRYAIAGVVTVLTVAVIAWAIVQSVRPETLYLSVTNGYVTIGKIKSMTRPVHVSISLTIHAANPGGRASIRYYNVSVHFLDNNSSEITFLKVPQDGLLVAPMTEQDAYVSSNSLTAPEDVSMEFASRMFKAQETKDATVTLEGLMQTQTSALNFTGGVFTKYSCSPVIIGTSPQNGTGDVSCTLQP